jgi:hypothetical protein
MPTIDLVGIIQPWRLTDECSDIDAPRFREKYCCTDFESPRCLTHRLGLPIWSRRPCIFPGRVKALCRSSAVPIWAGGWSIYSWETNKAMTRRKSVLMCCANLPISSLATSKSYYPRGHGLAQRQSWKVLSFPTWVTRRKSKRYFQFTTTHF